MDDQGRRFVRRASMRQQLVDDRLELRAAGMAHHGAAQAGDVPPVDVRRAVGAALVPADEHEHVAGAGERERDPRAARAADRVRDARHHLERHALAAEEHGLLAAAVEQQRIAPLQPGHGLPFARLLHQQAADGVMLDGLRHGRADVDALRIRTGGAQLPGVHAVVVHDDVRRAQTTQAAHGDQRRVARS